MILDILFWIIFIAFIVAFILYPWYNYIREIKLVSRVVQITTKYDKKRGNNG